MKPKFSLSSLLWATALVAILVAWWLDRHRLIAELRTQRVQIDFLDKWRNKFGPELIRLRAENNDLTVKIMELENPGGGRMTDFDPFADPKSLDDEPPMEDAAEGPKRIVVPRTES